MNAPDILGEQTTYGGLTVYILDEGGGAYRVQIIDGADGLSSTCAGYTAVGIRERALELAYGYLLKRDGTAPKPSSTLPWRPIRI